MCALSTSAVSAQISLVSHPPGLTFTYMTTAHLESLRSTIQDRQVTSPPYPWIESARYVVAGLLEVGFHRDSDLLLGLSASGLGVFDCLTGEKVAREHGEFFFPNRYLECEGIGPLAGSTIRMSGVSGGGLAVAAPDNWHVETVTLTWPDHHLLLVEPDSWLHGERYNRPWVFYKLAVERELRAFGFSWSGNSLVIATSGSLTIYRRQALKASSI